MKVQARTRASAAIPASKDKNGKDIPAVPAQPARGPVEVEINIPEGLDDQVKAFGKDVIQSSAQAAIVISAQAQMRRLLDKGKNAAEIQAEMAKWKPDVKSMTKMSAFEKASTSVEKLNPQERAELLKKLQALK